jgi:methylated-DNA-[protein]-cysteine S-methyltransferase|tara:strand:- start:231 stop:596 length:366 start_codon:yes stop_codon:yes gene_type:complete
MKSQNKSFNEKCYSLLSKVPKGKVTTYKALALALNTKAYRAIGRAMNKNPYAFPRSGRVGGLSPAKQRLLVPCHRVINSSGALGGFAHGIPAKISLLKAEGVLVLNNKIDLKIYEHKFNQK